MLVFEQTDLTPGASPSKSPNATPITYTYEQNLDMDKIKALVHAEAHAQRSGIEKEFYNLCHVFESAEERVRETKGVNMQKRQSAPHAVAITRLTGLNASTGCSSYKLRRHD